jgi:type 1 glutamine amidotransferase
LSKELNVYAHKIWQFFFIQGRVLFLPHLDYTKSELFENDMSIFLENAIKWLAKKPNSFNIGTEEKRPLIKYTEQLKVIPPQQLASQKDIHVYVFSGHSNITNDGIKSVKEFVKKGGGLLVAGHNQQGHHSILSYPGNK